MFFFIFFTTTGSQRLIFFFSFSFLTGGDTERAERVQEQRDGGARLKQTPHQVSVCIVHPLSVAVVWNGGTRNL